MWNLWILHQGLWDHWICPKYKSEYWIEIYPLRTVFSVSIDHKIPHVILPAKQKQTTRRSKDLCTLPTISNHAAKSTNNDKQASAARWHTCAARQPRSIARRNTALLCMQCYVNYCMGFCKVRWVGVSRQFSAAEVDVRLSGRLQRVVGSICYRNST